MHEFRYNNDKNQLQESDKKTNSVRHVPDGEAFGNIDSEVMRARQGRDKLQRERAEAADYAVSAAHKDVLLTYHQTIGTGRL